jgi:hypothetical protein
MQLAEGITQQNRLMITATLDLLDFDTFRLL